MIHQRVAFDFHRPDFQTHIKDWDRKSVKDHIHHLLEDRQNIRCIIESKAKKQKCQEHADYIILLGILYNRNKEHSNFNARSICSCSPK